MRRRSHVQPPNQRPHGLTSNASLEAIPRSRLIQPQLSNALEGINLGPPLRLEAPVTAQGVIGPGALADRDVDALRVSGTCPFAITQPVLAAPDLDDTEHVHDGVVEALGG